MAIAELHKRRPRGGPPRRKNSVVATTKLEAYEDNLVEGRPRRHGLRCSYVVTYQSELVLCGKPKCRKWHGPYWYAYWTEEARTRTLYIGKALRPARVVLAEQRAKRAEKKA